MRAKETAWRYDWGVNRGSGGGGDDEKDGGKAVKARDIAKRTMQSCIVAGRLRGGFRV